MRHGRHGRWLPALTALALGVTMLFATAGAAEAKPAGPDGEAAALVINTFENVVTRRYMDDSELGFRTFPYNGSVHQQWRVTVWADQTRRFQNVATGRCIYNGPRGFNTQPCDSSEEQSWFVIRLAQGRIAFKNQATDLCIDDSNSSGFRTTGCNGGQFQIWI